MSYPVSTSIHLRFDTEYRISAADQAVRIAKCGFRRLDFNFLDWHGDARSPFLGDDWLSWGMEVGEAAARAGAEFNQAHAPVFGGKGPAGDFSVRDLQLRAIEICSKLGIPWMVYHAINRKDDTIYDVNKAHFTSLLDACHKYNVGIAIENIWPVMEDVPISRTENLIRLVDYIGDPLVGICWDTGHCNVVGRSRYAWRGDAQGHLADSADQYAQLLKVGKRLKALHIDDNGGLDDDHLEPFAGTIDWNSVMRGLRDIGYEHSFTFEAHNAVRRLPESLVDRKIALLHDIGKQLVSWDEAHPFG